MSLEEQNENKNLEHLDKEALRLESELESENGESLLVGDDEGQMSPEEKEAKTLSERFGKVLQQRQSMTINRNGTITRKNHIN